jgi:hypothetical protein
VLPFVFDVCSLAVDVEMWMKSEWAVVPSPALTLRLPNRLMLVVVMRVMYVNVYAPLSLPDLLSV